MLECLKGCKKASVAGIEGAMWKILKNEVKRVREDNGVLESLICHCWDFGLYSG